MSVDKKDFYGKEVTDAIKMACDTFGEPQENLIIEVVATGSTGIFGLIRKKAHIRVSVKPEEEVLTDNTLEMSSLLEPKEEAAPPQPEKPKVSREKQPTAKVVEKATAKEDVTGDDAVEEASPESVALVKSELLQLVELMGFPSTVDVVVSGNCVDCVLQGEFEANLTGGDGKVLDSLQYLLRKIVARKIEDRLRISVDAGDFRQDRLESLKVKAVELAEMVKVDGKTQVVPALNPAERREIHMVLQEDKEIRSRSVGEGLFKKILIYKPGKGNRPGGKKRSRSKNRPQKAQPKQEPDSKS